MSFFRDTIWELEQVGVADVILPFILLFTVTYAVLMKIKLFGQKSVNVAIAFVIGLVPVFQHVLAGRHQTTAISIINNSIPQIVLILVAVLALIILLGLWGVSPSWDAKAGSVVVIAAIGFIAYVFLSNSGFGWYDLPRWLDRGTMTIVIALLVFGLIIKFIVGGPELTDEEKAAKEEKAFFKSLGKMVKKAGE